MAECIVLKGGGADLDVITATSPDVLAGKVIVDKDGNPLTGTLELTGDAADSQVLDKKTYYNKDAKVKRSGTMPNRGAVTAALNAGGSYAIPAGYHNGSGKVTANSLASQTPGNASAGHMLSGQTAWVNGSKITGNIVSMGGQTITPGSSQQTISCYGKYMTGNVVVKAVSNLSAGNIKKGVNVAGVIGIFEGYVPIATDLYLRGNNISGWIANGYVTLDSGQITLTNSENCKLWTGQQIKLTGHNKLNVQGYTSTGSGIEKNIALRQRIASNNFNTLGYLNLSGYGSGDYTYSFDISSHQITCVLQLDTSYMIGAIYRIWFS